MAKSKIQPEEKKNLAKTPSECTSIEVTEELKTALLNAKIDLTLNYPFLGFLVMSSSYFYTTDLPTMAATTIPTATVYINPDFMLNVLKNRKERAFVLAHEILHIFLDHIGRQREANYNHKLWNIATDFCINGYLKDMDSASKAISMPSFGLYDAQYVGMSADAIYHKLLEEAQNNPAEACSGYGEPGDSDGTDDNGNPQKRPFDEISAEEVDAATQAENKQKIAAAMANDQNGRDMGSSPSHLQRAFAAMIDPVIPWKNLLQEFIVESAKTRYTYNRVSRKSGRVIFPTMTGDHIKLAVGVDTSGSMSSSDLNEAASEIQSIMETFDSWEMALMSCDTDAHLIGEYDSDEGDDFSTIDKGLVGGGGTDMSSMVTLTNEMDELPAALIIITDGYIPTIQNIEDVDVIVVVTRAGNHQLMQDDCQIIYMNDA